MSRTGVTTAVTTEQHRQRAQQLFGKLPCLIQAKASIAQMRGSNVVFISGTGTGKTYTFWMPLAHDDTSIIVVISPLNVLADQQASDLAVLDAAGIKAIALKGDSCSRDDVKDITKGIYRVVLMPPELVHDARLADMWNSSRFTSRLARLVFDEAHCLSQWGRAFREAYLKAASIRWRLPDHVRFYLASATMPEEVLDDCMKICGLSRNNTTIIRGDSDRPNIRLTVRPMTYTQKSCADLAWLVPKQTTQACDTAQSPPEPPPKFLVFCNTRREAERTGQYLRNRAGPEYQHKIVWFHSGMSDEFKREKIEALKRGELWGMTCTDAAGMGIDIADIELVVQWKATPSLCTLWQRFGRAARDPNREGLAVLIVEKSLVYRPPKPKPKPKPRGSRDKNNKDDTSSSSGSDSSDNEGGDSGGAPDRAAAATPAASSATKRAVPPDGPATTQRPQKRRRIEVEPAMDRFINAQLTCKCRRRVALEYLSSDNIDTGPYCCPRCATKEARICCDLCCPTEFSIAALDPSDKPERTRRRKKLKLKPYETGQPERQLRAALLQLRAELGKREFGNRMVAHAAFLSDQLLSLIVDYAHLHALKTVDDLAYYTSWVYADEYGQQVIDAVLKHIPLPGSASNAPIAGTGSTTRMPLSDATNRAATSASEAPTKRPRGRAHCGKCGMAGHNKKNKDCPGSEQAAAQLVLAQPMHPLVRAAAAGTAAPSSTTAPVSTTRTRTHVLRTPPAPSQLGPGPDEELRSPSPGWLQAAAAFSPPPLRTGTPPHAPIELIGPGVILSERAVSSDAFRSPSPGWTELAMQFPIADPPDPLHLPPSTSSSVPTHTNHPLSPIPPSNFYRR